MSGHTPGLWSAEYDEGYDEWRIVSESRTGYLAEVFCYEPNEDDTPEDLATPEEAEANARLIAASPDLLDALREIYHAFLDADGTHTDSQETASLKACAAIFKATGGIT
jgi:hypothetical protein